MANNAWKSKAVFIVHLTVMFQVCSGNEPLCSKYHYEERILEKLVRMEYRMELVTEKVEKSVQEIAEQQADLNKEKAKMVTDLEAVKKRLVQEQTTQIERIDQAIQDHQANVTRLSEDLQTLANRTIDDIKEQTSKLSVLFSAHTSSSTYISAGNTLVFTTVLVNNGDGYDSSTGVFTAPQEGVYSFSAQICTYNGKYARFQIIANDQVLTAATQYQTGIHGDCATSTTFVHVQAGARVLVRCASADSGSVLYASTTYSLNMFSGVLIH